MPSGVTVWFTGLPSAGKTTIANLVAKQLEDRGVAVEVLDGDVVRTHLSKGLGFSKADRDENIRRIGYVAGLLTRHGATVLVSAISPYRAVRDEVRGMIGSFLEVWVATDLETCRRRDVKGLYAKQARGELTGLTGVDDPYEPPLNPELVIRTEHQTPQESAAQVIELLERGGYLAARGAAAPRRGGPPAPHGGVLVNRLVENPERLAAEAARLPAVTLDGRGLADLECLAVGAFSPLTGFMGPDDHARVVAEGRLASGLVWTLPVTLPVPEAALRGAPDRLALTDGRGVPLAVMDIDAVHAPDPKEEARGVYGTDDPAHPGVAATLARAATGPLVAGPVHVIRLPEHPAELGPRLTPAEVRAEMAARGWRSMVGFQTRNPIHRAHEYLTKVALEQTDGLLLHPLVGETKADDVPARLRMACYRALLEGYYPPGRVLLSAFPAAMRYAGPREAIFHALVRRNYGCTHFIVGRDHAGVGNWYGTYAAQEAFDAYDPAELGITPLKFEHAAWCRRCGQPATPKTCPHGPDERVAPSGTKVREMLAAGTAPPVEFSRPEVARLLIEGMARGKGA